MSWFSRDDLDYEDDEDFMVWLTKYMPSYKSENSWEIYSMWHAFTAGRYKGLNETKL